MKLETLRKPGAPTLDEVEAEIWRWLCFDCDSRCGGGSPYQPTSLAHDESWPVRALLIELLEGHGIDCSGAQ